MSRVFITGIAGFLGSHLADRFIAEGHSVGGVDNFIGGYVDNVPSGAFWLNIDCNEFDTLAKVMRLWPPDVVIHCAALAYEGLSVFSPHIVTQNIVSASTAVFSASIAAGVKRIVHCSSMARYGTGRPPFSEHDSTWPQDPYGIGKLCSENMLRNLCRTHGVEYTIAVPHNIIGSRQKYDDPYRNVASIMINRCLQGLPIIIYGDGTQQRCFSYIDDCIQCLMKMVFQPNVVGQVINIGPDEGHISVNKLAETVMRLCGARVPIQYMTGRPQEVTNAYCSSQKARNFLGYETKWGLEFGLAKMIQYIKDRGPKPFNYHLPLEIVNEKTPKTWTEKLF